MGKSGEEAGELFELGAEAEVASPGGTLVRPISEGV